MSYPFERIVILYNPKSTGDSKTNAQKLVSDLEGKVPAELELLATKYAGHAEEVATSYATKDAKVLLISSSGDGGYHELINGVLDQDTKNVYTLVIPSGNANDHHHAMASGDSLDDLAKRIISPKPTQIDALKISAQIDGQPWQRYAHSYAGIGLTAYVGKKLAKFNLNPVNEKIILLKYLLLFRSVAARLGNESWYHYSSLLFGNINQISKVVTLGENAQADDGKFEIYTTRARGNLALISTLLIGSLHRLKPIARVDSISFTTKRNTDLQCDGEAFLVDGQVPVTVSMAVGAIRTLA